MVEISNTGLTNVGGSQPLDNVQPTTGTNKPSSTPGVDTSPPPVDQQGGDSQIPRNDPPRLDPKEMTDRFREISGILRDGHDVDISVLMDKLQELQSKLGDEQVRGQTNEVKANKATIQANVDKQLEKLGEQMKKLEEQGTWDIVKKVFSVAAAVLGVVAAIGMAIVSGGAALPAAIGIAAALIGATVSILSTFNLTDKVFDMLGVTKDSQVRSNILLGINIACIVLSITSAVGGAISAARQAATQALPSVAIKLTWKTLETTTKGATMTVGTVKTVGEFMKMGGQIGLVATKVGEGINQIGRTVVQGELDQIDTDRKNLQVVARKMQQEELYDSIKKLMQELEDGVQITTQVVQSQSTTIDRMRQHMT